MSRMAIRAPEVKKAGLMNVAATEFRARCLALLDQVHRDGCSINITKRGRVVARLVPARDDDEKPWLRIRGHARWRGDPFAPAVGESDG
jgi:prevent-host-death family protein